MPRADNDFIPVSEESDDSLEHEACSDYDSPVTQDESEPVDLEKEKERDIAEDAVFQLMAQAFSTAFSRVGKRSEAEEIEDLAWGAVESFFQVLEDRSMDSDC